MVKGTEKDDRIDVTVEMYIELQAPPEQIVRGMDKEENILSITSFKRFGIDDCSEWTRVKNE